MNELRIYADNDADLLETIGERDAITARLQSLGVVFEQWPLSPGLDRDAGQDEVIEAYREDIDDLMRSHGLESLDVIRISPDHPQRDALRCKFMREHVHGGMEIRCFVEGNVLFYLRTRGRIYSICCAPGDVIGIPADMVHWVDVGEYPLFTAIRLFPGDSNDGEPRFTGNDIAERFPQLEQVGVRRATAM